MQQRPGVVHVVVLVEHRRLEAPEVDEADRGGEGDDQQDEDEDGARYGRADGGGELPRGGARGLRGRHGANDSTAQDDGPSAVAHSAAAREAESRRRRSVRRRRRPRRGRTPPTGPGRAPRTARPVSPPARRRRGASARTGTAAERYRSWTSRSAAVSEPPVDHVAQPDRSGGERLAAADDDLVPGGPALEHVERLRGADADAAPLPDGEPPVALVTPEHRARSVERRRPRPARRRAPRGSAGSRRRRSRPPGSPARRRPRGRRPRPPPAPRSWSTLPAGTRGAPAPPAGPPRACRTGPCAGRRRGRRTALRRATRSARSGR